MEQEVMKSVLHEILQELKGQKEQFSGLRNNLDKLNEKCFLLEEKLARPEVLSSALSQEQMTFLKELMAENFEVLKAEMKKHPTFNTTHKHFALLPLNFRLEHFPVLVNTVMRWVVVLMVLVFTMRQISNLVNKPQPLSPEEQKLSVMRL